VDTPLVAEVVRSSAEAGRDEPIQLIDYNDESRGTINFPRQEIM